MRFLWKIASEIYCFLISLGIKFPIPNIFFNIPTKKLEQRYLINIKADPSFNKKERENIEHAIKIMEEFTNGIFKFEIDFNLQEQKFDAFSILLIKIHSKSIIAKTYDKQYNAYIIGIYHPYADNKKIIYLIHDRLITNVFYYTTAIHEFGHYMGMDHTKENSIMQSINHGNIPHLTYIDAVEFAKIYKCDIADLKYLKLWWLK